MLPGIRYANLHRIEEIHNKILDLNEHITYRIFPIYIRYLIDDEMFAIFYFHIKARDYVEVGFSTPYKISDKFTDASWMRYKEIKYSIKITRNDDIDPLFSTIKSTLQSK